MAKKLTPDSERGNAGHNAAARAKIIRNAVGEVIRLKGEKAAIQEQITEVRGQIKSLGIKAAEFNTALRFYELEVEDRDGALDNLREMFKALGLGQQLNFLDAIEEDEPAAPKKGRGKKGDGHAEEPAQPAADAGGFTQEVGFDAGKAGAKRDTNPHPAGSVSFYQWDTGWLRGQEKIVSEMAPA